MSAQIREQLCGNDADCEIVSNIPDCIESIDLGNQNSISNNTFYNLVKRDLSDVAKIPKLRPRNKTNIKLRFFTRVGKKLGIWNRNITRSENLKVNMHNKLGLNRSAILRCIINLKFSQIESKVRVAYITDK